MLKSASTWRSKEDVAEWAKDPEHVAAKVMEWYEWVRGILWRQ